MREIKFRAWYDLYDEMFKVNSVTFGIGGFSVTGSTNLKFEEKRLLHIEVELMQYTGLKDKNGVEIYEGDIVTYRDMYIQDKTRVIQWNGLLARFEAYHDSSYTAMDTWFEVIGNIYENPELLKDN